MKANVLKAKVVHERYIVEELLGQGGFGAVYRVRDRRVKGNVFALKEVVNPNQGQQQNFLFEGEILRRLDHPGLPRVYRVFEESKQKCVYMLMDYVEGPNLEQLRLQQPQKRFPLSQALQLMAPIIEAVSYLHAQQPPIIHRDIKPANVIVSPLGEDAMLVDFGIAKEYDQDSTTAVVRQCSPGYGAPEQYIHGTSMQTDIYGLGATFYVLLTGEVPIDALYRITSLSAQRSDPLVSAHQLAPSVPVRVAEVLQRALAINSSDRFASVEEFWEALQTACGAQDVQASGIVLSAAANSLVTRPLASLSVHSDTTLLAELPSVTDGKVWQGPHPRRTIARRKHLRPLLSGLIALIVVALSSGMAMGSLGLWSAMKPAALLSSNALITPQASSATPLVGSSPSQNSAPAQNMASYPSIAFSYTGTIHNAPQDSDATLSLLHIRQDGLHIHGYYTVESGSDDSNSYYSTQSIFRNNGYFAGKVTMNNKIHFLIPGGESDLPLLFSGQFQPDGSISGTYCRYWNDQCQDASGEYGSWQVIPAE